MLDQDFEAVAISDGAARLDIREVLLDETILSFDVRVAGLLSPRGGVEFVAPCPIAALSRWLVCCFKWFTVLFVVSLEAAPPPFAPFVDAHCGFSRLVKRHSLRSSSSSNVQCARGP